MKYIQYFDSKIGRIGIVEQEGKIIQVKINTPIQKKEEKEEKTPLLEEGIRQLKEYFAGTRKQFELPLYLEATDFKKQVWKELIKIPYGKTATYKQIAEKIGNPKAARAVGMANHNNPIPIIIPCHRVIGTNGKLTGYALGLEMKEKLLVLEKEKEEVTQR